MDFGPPVAGFFALQGCLRFLGIRGVSALVGAQHG